MTATDPGLPGAVERVHAAAREAGGWANAETLVSAARDDVPDLIQQAKADAWSEGFKAGRGADHQQCWWPANPHRNPAPGGPGA